MGKAAAICLYTFSDVIPFILSQQNDVAFKCNLQTTKKANTTSVRLKIDREVQEISMPRLVRYVLDTRIVKMKLTAQPQLELDLIKRANIAVLVCLDFEQFMIYMVPLVLLMT